MLIIHTDGASLGNPGPMGAGVAVYKDGKLVKEISEYLGNGTNNIAEYTAVIHALETAHEMDEKEVVIRSDSQLLVRQMNGEYKVRDPNLKKLRFRIQGLCVGIKVTFEHIPREENKIADKLSKKGAEKQ